jgi:N-acetylglucosaminyldiphosphoundecaprenol N-acetyl-beta-D-mannosaminyltransferase
MQETLALVEQHIRSKEPLHHTVVNAGKLVAMQTDQKLKQSVTQADLINADGQAVVWASKFLGSPLKERVAGIDLMEHLVELAGKKGYGCFFFGAKEDVVKEVVNTYHSTYGEQIIAGYRNGYFTKDEELGIVKQIQESNADMLFVAMSSPMKENFLYTHRKAFEKIPFIMGVGGSFDVIAGKVKRAPLWMQKSGLEWLYRVIQEPKRMFKRYLVGNTKFLLLTIKEKFRSNRA